MRYSKFFYFCLSLGFFVFLLTGCSKKTAEAMDADANGYQCVQCKTKFFTDKNVWAEFCPSCKASGPAMISAVVCPKDKHMTIRNVDEPFNPGGLKCEKCGALTDVVGLPRASELQAWGATKKARADVCSK